jgi:hypothetical protein
MKLLQLSFLALLPFFFACKDCKDCTIRETVYFNGKQEGEPVILQRELCDEDLELFGDTTIQVPSTSNPNYVTERTSTCR